MKITFWSLIRDESGNLHIKEIYRGFEFSFDPFQFLREEKCIRRPDLDSQIGLEIWEDQKKGEFFAIQEDAE